MKKIIPVFTIFFLMACNNAGDTSHQHGQGSGEAKTPEDSLMDLVQEGHNVAMAKMSKLSKAQQRIQKVSDSINKLPGKFRQAAEPYQIQLDSLMKNLQYAENSMNRWMEEFAKTDTLPHNTEIRLKYLESEQQKVTTVKENILSSLQKADSLLKK